MVLPVDQSEARNGSFATSTAPSHHLTSPVPRHLTTHQSEIWTGGHRPFTSGRMCWMSLKEPVCVSWSHLSSGWLGSRLCDTRRQEPVNTHPSTTAVLDDRTWPLPLAVRCCEDRVRRSSSVFRPCVVPYLPRLPTLLAFKAGAAADVLTRGQVERQS